MVELYSGKEYYKQLKLMKKMKIVFFSILALDIVLTALFVLLAFQEPYGSSVFDVYKGISIAINCGFAIFVVYYMLFLYKENKAYLKFLNGINLGQRATHLYIFSRYEEIKTKDSILSNVLIFKEYSEKKQQYMERKILVDKRKPVPQFSEGDKVCFTTHSLYMLAYEVLGKADLSENISDNLLKNT